MSAVVNRCTSWLLLIIDFYDFRDGVYSSTLLLARSNTRDHWAAGSELVVASEETVW